MAAAPAAAEADGPGRAPVVLEVPAGTAPLRLSGTVRGYEPAEYLLRAGAGQRLEAVLDTASTSLYFNILPPGSDAWAMFAGERDGARASRILPVAGDYTVRVYLVRAVARRGRPAAFSLTLGLSGRALAPLPAARDALVPGTAFHATASLRCVAPPGPGPGACEAGAVRYGGGDASVELRGAGGYLRRILFLDGKPAASDALTPMEWSRRDGAVEVRFGREESVEVPDALVLGG